MTTTQEYLAGLKKQTPSQHMKETTTDYARPLIAATTSIVAAYVSNNAIQHSDLPGLIIEVHKALNSTTLPTQEVPNLTPAVSIKKSVTPDHIICLEDGKKFKSLKRHLHSHYNLTPEEYRQKWSLPPDYPMVAPNYAAQRSELAKKMGLGQQGRKSMTAANTNGAAA